MRGALEVQGEVDGGILFEYRDVFQKSIRDVRERTNGTRDIRVNQLLDRCDNSVIRHAVAEPDLVPSQIETQCNP